jgi:hypothetical protein
MGHTVRKTNASILGFEVLTTVIVKSSIFWNITPCSPLKVNRRFGETSSRVPPAFTQVSCLVYSPLKMVCFSETSVDFQRTTPCNIPEDIILHNHRCEYLEAYVQIQFVPHRKHNYVSPTKSSRLMLFKERVAVYCENHTEHTNTLCGQNAEF